MAGIARLIRIPKMWPEIFPRRAIRRHAARPADRSFHPSNFFCVADYRSVPRSIGAEVAPRLGQDSTELGAPSSGSAKGFWIFHIVRSLLQKTWNGVIAPVFPILAAQLRLWCRCIGLVGLASGVFGRASGVGATRPPADIAFVMAAVVIFVFAIRSNRPWEWDNLNSWCGATSYSAVPVERHHRRWPSGTRGNVSAALRFRIYHAAWRPCLPDTRALD